METVFDWISLMDNTLKQQQMKDWELSAVIYIVISQQISTKKML